MPLCQTAVKQGTTLDNLVPGNAEILCIRVQSGGANSRRYLWRWRHLLSAPDKCDIDTVLLILRFVVEAELGIRSDDSNLAHVAQHLGPVVLPVA